MPFFTWNGFYAGINAGYGFGASKWTDTVTGVSTGNFDVGGALVGGTAGYNLQLGGWVFGIEGDIGWNFIKGSTATGCGTRCETASDWLGTLRGRFGYAFDRFLPYFTGGVAFGDIEGTAATAATSARPRSAGPRAAASNTPSCTTGRPRLEYLYVDLGTATCSAACSGGNPFDVKYTTQVVRGGLNYKF